jgi:peptide/nickel transport system substrate-binding protein
MRILDRVMRSAAVLAVAAALGLSAAPAFAQTMGGEMILAQGSNPPSLDAMTTSSEASRNINLNIYEQLVTVDENVTPIPMLAEGWTVSDDGLTYVFTLRDGVLFHDGSEMTAEDVVASLERYREYGATRNMLNSVDAIEATGDHEVTFTMKKAQPTFIESFASVRAPAVIIPAEEAAKAPDEIEIIGTGPYRFVEYVPDSHVTLERVADTDHDGPKGFGGNKTAYLDTATFRIIPEAGARIAALEAGEIHWADQLPVPAAMRMMDDPDINVYEARQWAMLTLILNWKAPPTDDVDFRRAVLLAIDPEEVMAIATEGFFDLNHAWQYPNYLYYPGDIGAQDYRQNMEAAKEALAASDYDGEEFVILTDPNYGEHSRAAVVIAGQLEELGINATVRQLDWPTVLQIRLTDEGWNGWTLMQGIEPFLGPYGFASLMTGERPHQRQTHPRLTEAYQDLVNGETVEARQEAFAELQRAIYDLVPQIKLGDVGRMQAGRAVVKGFDPFRAPRVYNVWLQE